MTPEQLAELEATMLRALAKASDEQIDTMATLVMKQAIAIRAMRDQPPEERMKLATVYTSLREESDTIWMDMLGLGVKMVATPDGAARGVAYDVETGAPLLVADTSLRAVAASPDDAPESEEDEEQEEKP